MLRRVVVTLFVPAALAVVAPAASAQTTTTTPVVTTTPTTVPRTTTPPTTRPRVTTTVVSSTTTPTTSATSTTVAGTDGGEGISGRTIALIVGVIAVILLLIAIVVMIMRRRQAQQWRAQAAQAATEGRSVLGLATHGLATLDQPAFAAQTWSELDRQGAQLHQRLQTLGRSPADDWSGSAVAGADQALQALRSSVESDRTLRLGPPPPTAEQLGYSEAVVRQRATDFEQALATLDSALSQVR